jgi:hypothetical protein
MKLPGLKRRPIRDEDPNDNYTRWGWYAMILMAVLWAVYSLFFE